MIEMIDDPGLNYFALGLLLFVIIMMVYALIAVHDIPAKIAESRHHPHADAIHAALGSDATIEQWQLNGDSLEVVDPGSRDSAATAAQAVGALLARPLRGEPVSAIAPEASGKYRLVKR